MTSTSSSSFQVKRPFGGTFFLSLGFLLLLLIGMEAAARTRLVQDQIASPQLGSRHYQLGSKVMLLERAIAEHGPLDCLVIGSSQADRAIDPEVLTATFAEVTGRPLHCFNFAVDALPVSGAAVLADILVREYHPGILIYGTDARDYAVGREAEDAAVILESSWVRYRAGEFNLDGWALEHFFFYRYWWHWLQLLQFDWGDVLDTRRGKVSPNGFTPDDTVNLDVQSPPNPEDESFQIGYYRELLSDYAILPENLADLERILALRKAGVRVYLVEMPLPDGFFPFFGRGRTDHEYFLTQIGAQAGRNQIPFWETTSLGLVPVDGWRDYSHLNSTGAAAFSAWLGYELGRADSGQHDPAVSR